jgi:hypothetical protein
VITDVKLDLEEAFEMTLLVTEVTPGLLAGEEPDAHQFYVTVCLYMG